MNTENMTGLPEVDYLDRDPAGTDRAAPPAHAR
jgi:hypothetical protein